MESTLRFPPIVGIGEHFWVMVLMARVIMAMVMMAMIIVLEMVIIVPETLRQVGWLHQC